MKARLQEAVEKKDPDRIAAALNSIERTVETSAIPAGDGQLIADAQTLVEKLDAPSRTFFATFFIISYYYLRNIKYRYHLEMSLNYSIRS